jgi:hypothetical protein
MTISNSNVLAARVNSFLATAREATKQVGDKTVQVERAKGVLMSSVVLAYQNSDEFLQNVNKYLGSRNLKLTSKETRSTMNEWAEKTFEFRKPGKGATGEDMTRYSNRLKALVTSMTRAKEYSTRGLIFSSEGPKVFVTKDSYNKVIAPDTLATADIEVAIMNKDGTKTTWSALAPSKVSAKVKGTATATILTGSAANFGMICNAAKIAAEAVTQEKMTGSDKLAALNAFFALQALLGAKEDKAMVKAYEDLTNDPARKSA